MNSETRKLKLLELMQNESNVAMTGVPLKYKGQNISCKVYRIPLCYLIYNKYNGRIGTEVKSYEAQFNPLNSEEEIHRKKIESMLWDSKVDRNKSTMENLLHNGQQKYGIVTEDGIIIDGNRRAMLLNRLYNTRRIDNTELSEAAVSHCAYFLAIILPDKADEKEIQKLEAMYQMGEDKKLDYNAIEKYLKCSDLQRVGYSESDIAEFMGEKTSQISDWLKILDLMKQYLEFYDYDGIYTRLDGTEGPFVDLQNYLESYNKQSGNAKTDWAYDETDIADLKAVCFDYIRARYEGKEFRDIAKTGRDLNSSIFSSEELWNSFLQNHREKVDSITNSEISVEDALKSEINDNNLSKILKSRDDEWGKKVSNLLKNNLKRHKDKLENKKENDKPEKLLEKCLDALNVVDESFDNPKFKGDENLINLLKEINKLSFELRKVIEK